MKASTGKNVSSKRPKTKTFTGCWSCRERHRKCDLRKPSCYVCEKDGIKCLGFTIRLCWDHSKSDNLRRTKIYDYTTYPYMNKTNEELDLIVNNMDEYYEQRKTMLPFSVFKLNDIPSDDELTDLWLDKIFLQYCIPLDSSDIGLAYVKFIRDSLKTSENNLFKHLLQQSITVSGLMWISQQRGIPNHRAHEMLSSTVDQFHLTHHLPEDLQSQCMYLTSICNCIFLLTIFQDDNLPLHSLKQYVRIGQHVLNTINAHIGSNIGHFDGLLIDQTRILNHLLRHFIVMGYFIDRSINLPVSLLREYDAQENIQTLTFLVSPYFFNLLSDLTLAFNGNSISSKKLKVDLDAALDIRMLFFKLEDILLRKDGRLFHPMASNLPHENILHHQLYLFYIAVYISFLQSYYPAESINISLRIMVEMARETIKQLIKYFKTHQYSPGFLWALSVIGLVATNKPDQDMIMSLLGVLSRSKLHQVNLVISILHEKWQQPMHHLDARLPFEDTCSVLLDHGISFLF